MSKNGFKNVCANGTWLKCLSFLQARERFNIPGNAIEDFFSSLFLYPSVAMQLDMITADLESSQTDDQPVGVTDIESQAGNMNAAFS